MGPSITKEYYLVDKKTLIEFYEKGENHKLPFDFTKNEKNFNFNYFNNLKEKNLNQIDLKNVAYRQLLNEYIPKTNIDISNLCTYELKNEFNSWRRSKTNSRQWNLICS